MMTMLMKFDWFFIATTIAKAVFVWGLTLFFIMINIVLDRKGSSLMQDRVGPNRAHILGLRLYGFILNFADAVKLLFKEDVTAPFVNRFFYLAGPFLIMAAALMGMAVVPFADDFTIGSITIRMQVLDINVGLLYILAITSLSVYSLVLAGFGSNSKYPLFSAMRSSAQMISYEIVMGLSLVGLVMVYGSLHLHDITTAQGTLLFGIIPKWGVVVQPLGCLLFCIASLAELNRTPFDLPEGESEIIGFHVEYSSMKFALFFMGEYANVFVASAVMVTLFFGGWQIPWLTTETIKNNAALVAQGSAILTLLGVIVVWFMMQRFYRMRTYRWKDMRQLENIYFYVALATAGLISIGAIVFANTVPFTPLLASILALVLQTATFIGKAALICFVIVILRWTLPRLRYDQLMALGWKIMLPLGIANILITGIILLLI